MSQIGKEFEFSKSEQYGLDSDIVRAQELAAQGRAMIQQAGNDLKAALDRAVGFCLERVGAPLDSGVDPKVKNGRPVGIKITAKKAPEKKTEKVALKLVPKDAEVPAAADARTMTGIPEIDIAATKTPEPATT